MNLRQHRCENLKFVPNPFLNEIFICVISGFRREVDNNCALQGCYSASSGNYFQNSLNNNPEERSSQF